MDDRGKRWVVYVEDRDSISVYGPFASRDDASLQADRARKRVDYLRLAEPLLLHTPEALDELGRVVPLPPRDDD